MTYKLDYESFKRGWNAAGDATIEVINRNGNNVPLTLSEAWLKEISPQANIKKLRRALDYLLNAHGEQITDACELARNILKETEHFEK